VILRYSLGKLSRIVIAELVAAITMRIKGLFLNGTLIAL
jgi:hypothetical protein